MKKKKKRIKYYGIKIQISLFGYDNYPAFTQPKLCLAYKIKNKRFKTREEAVKFFESIKITSTEG